MRWIKALHIVFMVTWFAGLFYLPRLFVYHTIASDTVGIERFKTMERKLFVIMTIGAAAAAIFGVWLLLLNPALLQLSWMQVKLALVAGLVGYHLYCWRLISELAKDSNRHSHVWYRWFNEAPTLLLIAIVILAVARPF